MQQVQERCGARRGRRVTATAVLAVPLALAVSGCCGPGMRRLPDGLSVSGEPLPTREVAFLRDLTYVDADGVRRTEQEIFDAVFAMIAGARRVIILDMFLYNDFQGAQPERTRALSAELTAALLQRRREIPGIAITVITDPINSIYGGYESPHLQALRQGGVTVIETDLTRLPDSNPAYSGFWRLLVRPFGNRSDGRLPSPFHAGRISLRSYLALLNFKANHRKVVVADSGDGYVGLVTSANPHDGSSAHANVALRFGGAAVADLAASESAVAVMSGAAGFVPISVAVEHGAALTVQVVTEGKIRGVVLDALGRAGPGARVDLVMFYLSHRGVITELKRAQARGARLRVVLDPNKDAFGRARGGIPNRQVARELRAAGVDVRWAHTHGEQCHSKMLLVRHAAGAGVLILGSANFTRRNLDDLNLETNVAVRGPVDDPVFGASAAYVDLLWTNPAGRVFTAPYSAFADESRWKVLVYRFMEWSGMSTF